MGYGHKGLIVPQEPVEIKSLIKDVRVRLAKEGYAGADCDSLSVWSFNRMPKYLWNEWGRDLKREGITWQEFLKILKLHTIDLIEWALYDRLEWEDMVRRIECTIETYAQRVDKK